MQIIIAGDLVPTISNSDLFITADVNSLLGDKLLLLWNQADIRIFNLEAPLTDKANPIDKNGYNLIAPINTINGIKALNPSLLTLANNHVIDQGIQGFRTTKETLKLNNIPFVGIGENLSEACKPYIIGKDKIKIGIYACAEHEFSIATKRTPGANPFDPLETIDHIQSLNNKCDYVIVLYHGGKELYRYPSPYLRKICRKLAQKGAHLVICQHSHCIGCFEEYEKSTIVYGQGNFLLRNSEYWDTSLLIRVNINKDINIDYIPIVKKGNCIRLADEEEMTEILNSFQHRSIELLNEDYLEQKYQEFAKANLQTYLRKISGLGRLFFSIDNRLFNGKLLKKIYNKKKLLALQNYIECEAHRELLIAGLKLEEK